MAEDVDVAQPADASVLDRLPMRDEDGEIRHEFVEEIARAIHAADTPLLRAIVAELHEADLGDLIAALEPDDRVNAGGTDRRGFRFLGAQRSRRLRPRGNPRGTRTGDGRGGRSRAGIRRRRRIARRSRRRGPGRDPRKTAAVGARRARAQPAVSGKFRRAADADRVHRGAAGLDRGAGDRLHARHAGFAGPVLRNLRGRPARSTGRARYRWTRCCARAGRCRWPI